MKVAGSSAYHRLMGNVRVRCSGLYRPSVLLSCHVSQIHKSAWLLILLSTVLQILIFPLPNLYMLSWVTITPFGSPVVPELYNSVMGVSGAGSLLARS